MPSTLKSLKKRLNIRPVNTGKKFITSIGLVHDDIEGLHAVTGLTGCVHFRSGTEMSTVHYRGQVEDYPYCVSTLDRCHTQKDQFLSILRAIVFEELLEKHPFIEITKNTHFVDAPICVDKTAIAQHYGLHTNFIDTTSSFDVASFFATCRWLDKDQKFSPVSSSRKPGVIYKINEMFMPPYVNNDDSIKSEFVYIGWQPLPRPKQQRANAVKMAKGESFDKISSVKKYHFKHSLKYSQKIYKKFKGGSVIFPKDSAADLADQCKKLLNFTYQQIETGIKRYEDWSGDLTDEERKKQLIDSSNITIAKECELTWDKLLDTDQQFWENKLEETLKTVRCRMTSPHIITD